MPSHPTYQNSYKKEGIIFKRNPPHQSMPNRSIITNIPDMDVCDNGIKTYKYTTLNFIPKNLFIQFSKVANLYFLIIGIMQMIRPISVSGGFPVIFVPLSIVVGVSAIKDFYEDLKRKASDFQINGKVTHVISDNGTVAKTPWMSLRIGNIIKVQKNQPFPADVILLCTSELNQNCFIETKNLDGETNLKNKKVKPQLSSVFLPHVNSENGDNISLQTLQQEFKYQRPNPYIHTFTGSYKSCPLDNNNTVLRGCSLKISKWVYGLVVYTGVDSKIMLNSNKTRQKKSRLQFKMGIIVAVIFLAQMAITFLCAFMSTMLSKHRFALTDWIDFATTNELMVKWGSWILLFTNFVPISLIVSLEMVKYIQGINITNSKFYTSEPSSVNVQTSTLNQELGQIQHVFSDKTGTLTKNYMSFKYMIAGYNTYGYDDLPHSKHANASTQFPPDITNVDFYDKKFMQMMSTQKLSSANNADLFDMFLSFSICHDVIIEKDDDSHGALSEVKKIKYNASSPDELAFINMARYCGFQYQGIDAHNIITVKYKDAKLRYKHLHTVQFNSDRKRMSVIVEQLPQNVKDIEGNVNYQILNSMENRVFVFVKGADNVITERLKNKDDTENKKLKLVKHQLDEWSVNGLRTLVFAKRVIKKQYYMKWAKMYAFSLSKLDKLQKKHNSQMKITLTQGGEAARLSRAQASPVINQKQTREGGDKFVAILGRLIIDDYGNKNKEQTDPTIIINKLLNDNSVLTESQKKFLQKHLSEIDTTTTVTSDTKQLQEVIEKQFELIGSTAIEDRLQDNVKITIQRLREAGVKVWMLTGDKKQTAINIGISCGLISQDMALIKWKQHIDEVLADRLQYPEGRDCCLVVTGEDLLKVTEQDKLLRLVNLCKSVICCRVTPKQKQDMVWLMRKNKCTTLGIGDGANDVNMINTAHVGVGIKGVEGAQAALCSDYAITQFQILGQLMLYHGRQAYRKNSQLILYNFYKNLILTLPQLWYGMNNYFSSANIYDPWIYQLYNVVYTSVPIAIFAIYDEKFNSKFSLQHPKLYREGLDNKLFNLRRVSLWFVFPIIFSFFMAVLTFNSIEQTINSEGYMFDLVSSGMCVFAQCVIICNVRVLTMSFRWSIGLIGSVIIGCILFWVTMALAAEIFIDSEIINLVTMQIGSLQYWFVIIMNVSYVFLIELVMSQWKTLKEKIQTFQQSHQKKQQIELPLLPAKGQLQFGAEGEPK